MPAPTKIAPLPRPRLAAGTCGNTVAATSTMMMPPPTPDKKRQPKNHNDDKGKAQPKKARLVITIISCSTPRLLKRRPKGRPSKAPAR